VLRKSRKRASSTKALNKKQWCALADALWARIVKLRAGNRCVLCGSDFMLEAHHMVAKGGCGYLRYSLENGLCLCRVCHFRFHNIDPSDAVEYMKTHRPEDYEYVQANKKNVCPTKNVGYYRDIVEYLEGVLKCA